MQDLGELRVYSAIQFELLGETGFEARWFGGSGINIIRDGEEVDYFQDFSIRTEDDFLAAVKNYIVHANQDFETDNSDEDKQS